MVVMKWYDIAFLAKCALCMHARNHPYMAMFAWL